MNDADLLREFRKGNKEVFSELVSRVLEAPHHDDPTNRQGPGGG